MDKIKNLLTKLTTGKNKKFFYIGLGIILILIIFLTVNKQSSLRNKNAINSKETVGNDYIGIKEDDGTRFYSFNTEEITYTDEDYGLINITINGQLFFRETHERSYYSSHPYDKREIGKQIAVYIQNAVYEIFSKSESIKYNHLRELLTNEKITEIIKEQVSSLGFEFVKVDIYSFGLSKDSINRIKEIELAKRVQAPTDNNNGATETMSEIPSKQPEGTNENQENQEQVSNNNE